MKAGYAVYARTLSGVVVVAAVTHLLMTAVYLSPPNLLKKDLGDVASWYMLPLFRQNWRLFGPAPSITSTKLAVRCNTVEHGWSSWRDPLETLYAKHFYYRISGHSKLIYIYGQIALVLEQEFQRMLAECKVSTSKGLEVGRPQCAFDRITVQLEQSGTYAMAKRYAQQVCEGWSPGQGSAFDSTARIDRIQFKLLTFYPLQYSERDQSGKRWSAVKEVVFRPVDFRTSTVN